MAIPTVDPSDEYNRNQSFLNFIANDVLPARWPAALDLEWFVDKIAERLYDLPPEVLKPLVEEAKRRHPPEDEGARY